MNENIANWMGTRWWADVSRDSVRIVGGIGICLLLALAGRITILFLVSRSFRPLIRMANVGDAARIARLKTLQAVFQSVLLYVLNLVVILLALDSIGVRTASLFATAGVAGLAIGFGAQKLVKDVVTGFLILCEDQFSVGDLVTIGANTGVVEETGMRITRLRDDMGRAIILSNGDISQVINYSKGRYRVAVDFALKPGFKIASLHDAVAAAQATLKSTIDVRDVTLRGLTSVASASLTYRFDATVAPEQRAAAEPALREALMESLAARGVEFA